jgi:hypothetical protein
MSISSNPSRPAAVARRRRNWRRTVLAAGLITAVSLLSAGCNGNHTYVQQIHHSPSSAANP